MPCAGDLGKAQMFREKAAKRIFAVAAFFA
jgi:hypothetical protein